MLFPVKLFKLLCSSETDKTIISWDAQGTSFLIHDPLRFSKEIMSVTFKTNTYSSFTRQLKLYSFNRILLPTMKKKRAYRHAFFLKAEPELCKKIKKIKVDNKITELAHLSQDSSLRNEEDKIESEQEKNVNKTKTLKRKAVDSLENSSLQKVGMMTSIKDGPNQEQELNQNLNHHLQEQDRLHIYHLNIQSHMEFHRQRILQSYATLIEIESHAHLMESQRLLSISPKIDQPTASNRSLHSLPFSVPLDIHASHFPTVTSTAFK